MTIASALLMFAGSPQTFVGYATAQDSLLPLFEILPVYIRNIRSQLEQRLIEVAYGDRVRQFLDLAGRAGRITVQFFPVNIVVATAPAMASATLLVAARMAVEDFGGKLPGKPVGAIRARSRGRLEMNKRCVTSIRTCSSGSSAARLRTCLATVGQRGRGVPRASL